MKNKLYILSTLTLVLTVTSCRKDLTGNAITIEVDTNDSISFLRLYNSCEPGPNQLPQGSWTDFTYLGNGASEFQLEKGYDRACYTVIGFVPANSDSTGSTTIDILAYYKEEGNVTGFQTIERKRPHGEFRISYAFRPDTYLE